MHADTGLGLLVLGIIGYFVPLIVAVAREHHQRMAIGVLTVFGGWTLVGWVIALVWACTAIAQPVTTPQSTRV